MEDWRRRFIQVLACPFMVFMSEWGGSGPVGLENREHLQRLQQPRKGEDGNIPEVRVKCSWWDPCGSLHRWRGSSRDVRRLLRLQGGWGRDAHASAAADTDSSDSTADFGTDPSTSCLGLRTREEL